MPTGQKSKSSGVHCPYCYCTVRRSPLRLSSVCTPALTCCNLLQLHSTTTTTTQTESPAQRLHLRGHNNKTIPTSLKGIFILFSFYGYSLLALALVSIVTYRPPVKRPFFSHRALVRLLFTLDLRFVPHFAHPKNYSVRTSTSLMTPRTTSVSSSVPLSSLGRSACGGWGVSR